MKKLTALSFTLSSLLTLVPQAHAVGFGSVDLCANSSGGLSLGNLCTLGSTGVGPLITSIINLLFVAAIILALGFLVYGGIKWITSGGDKGKVDAARGMIVAALVGLVLVFLSYFIINLAGQFFGVGSITDTRFTLPTLSPR